MGRTKLKKYRVVYSVDGVPGEPITKVRTEVPWATKKDIKTRIIQEYGGRKVTFHSIELVRGA